MGSESPTQGSNQHPLHWKADSYPLDHQGSPGPLGCFFVQSLSFCSTSPCSPGYHKGPQASGSQPWLHSHPRALGWCKTYRPGVGLRTLTLGFLSHRTFLLPGKSNFGVSGQREDWEQLQPGHRFCMFARSEDEVKVTQSCSILCDPMDYTAHGILQARILE